MGRLTQLLSTLATDSNRRRGKAERKVQRSAFRDILKTVEVSITFTSYSICPLCRRYYVPTIYYLIGG